MPRNTRIMSRRMAGVVQDRFHPARGGGVPALRQPPESQRKPPDRAQAHLLQERAALRIK
jgi:hypothetical protein